MSKTKIKYICSNCGYETLKWLGKCPSCNEWNTFSEELVEERKGRRIKKKETVISKLSDISQEEDQRIKTGIDEFDRVLGGGLMPGSVTLLGGDPGIGKSTLVIQAAAKIQNTVLYVTGEESVKQINIRAKRLGLESENLLLLAETDLTIIKDAIKKNDPFVVIIDSIQTVYDPDLDNSPGTITQIRESTAELLQLAKGTNCAIIIIGHVTKDGFIAGPKVLEHIVDTVLQFEGEKNYSYRILRAQKNRFGSTNEIGVFDMRDDGLHEVKNPSEIFIGEREKEISGSIITSSIEGTRPVLLEVQALVTPSHFGNPQRVATGFDYRRLSILLAVLEKRAALRLSSSNVFLNMAGGIKIEEPAIDLAVCCAIASSLKNISASPGFVVVGEVGLGGEVRSVSHIEKRIQEAEKLGFEQIILPKSNLKSVSIKNKIKIHSVENILEAIQLTIGE
ncbi:MAG: DNA repair protein RadA [Melioribacteraceae bacterium]|nr:DNA repair protein RadA [Melioribacteraceae bacterium]